MPPGGLPPHCPWYVVHLFEQGSRPDDILPGAMEILRNGAHSTAQFTLRHACLLEVSLARDFNRHHMSLWSAAGLSASPPRTPRHALGHTTSSRGQRYKVFVSGDDRQ